MLGSVHMEFVYNIIKPLKEVFEVHSTRTPVSKALHSKLALQSVVC